MTKLGRRQPHQILLCAWCVIAGIAFIAGVAPTPGSVAALLPTWVLWVWYLLLIVGGSIGIVGAFWPRRRIYTGLQLERAAMIFLAAGTCMYMMAMIAAAGARAIGAAGFMCAWAGACVWRALQTHADLRALAAFSQERQ